MKELNGTTLNFRSYAIKDNIGIDLTAIEAVLDGRKKHLRSILKNAVNWFPIRMFQNEKKLCTWTSDGLKLVCGLVIWGHLHFKEIDVKFNGLPWKTTVLPSEDRDDSVL